MIKTRTREQVEVEEKLAAALAAYTLWWLDRFEADEDEADDNE